MRRIVFWHDEDGEFKEVVHASGRWHSATTTMTSNSNGRLSERQLRQITYTFCSFWRRKPTLGVFGMQKSLDVVTCGTQVVKCVYFLCRAGR
jgi:hypothetical protein